MNNILTDKCKDEFEKWLSDNMPDGSLLDLNDGYCDLEKEFFNIPFSMQWGVYQDFFDSFDIYIQIETRVFDKKHPVFICVEGDIVRTAISETRPEARKQAIIKANEIFNKQFNKNKAQMLLLVYL